MKVSVSFQQGKQNQDIDERFITNGEYRELINGRVLDSDTENSGCITSLSGTQVMFNESGLIKHGYKAIATTAHEDLLYVFFSHVFFGNVIVEYDTINRKSQVVFVDGDISLQEYPELFLYLAGEVNFQDSFKRFTKINPSSDVTMHVFEGMLFFHDREDEPFKINIERAKELNYYTSREQITVAKMPPQAPYVSTNIDNDNIQNFNAGDYKFGVRYIYDDGEVSAVSPLSSMPIATCEVLDGVSDIKTGGNLEINEYYIDSEDTDIAGTYYNLIEPSIDGGYRLETNIKKKRPSSSVSDFVYSFTLKKGEEIIADKISFYDIDDNLTGYSSSEFEASYTFNLSFPIVASFSSSRKNDGKDIMAWVVNPRWGYIQGTSSQNWSELFIYNASNGKGYFLGYSTNWYHSVYVTKDGDVYTSVNKGKRYRLWKFNFQTEKFVEVLGATDVTNVKHQIAKTRTIATNDYGNIVYYAHTREDETLLFQSLESGAASTFKVVGTRNLMFAEQLQYFNDFKGDDQNRWSVSTCCSADGLIVYVGCCNCIARSEDAGNTWHSHIIDDNVKKYGAVIDLQCSSDGKVVYAVMGVADNKNIDITYDSALDSVNDANTFIHYSGNLYVSHSYGKSFTKVTPYTGFRYPAEKPTSSRIRSITCNDSGSVVLAQGWAWSYYKYNSAAYNKTDLLNAGEYTVPTTNTFMSTNFGGSMYLIAVHGAIEESHKHGFNEIYGHLANIYSRFNELYDFTFVAHNRSVNDIKHTKIENNVSSVNIYTDCTDPHVDRVQIIMNHNGSSYIVKDTKRTKLTNPYIFYNDGVYGALSSKDANKLYDNVPLKANSSDIAQNTLFFGGYTDGYDAIDLSGVNVTESYTTFNKDGVNISLKGGETYNYGLIAYDKYNRSTGVSIIGGITPKSIHELKNNQVKLAKITFPTDFKFPDWVSHFKFCRTKTRNNYYIINGFDSVKSLGNKLFLEVTYNTSVAPNVGDNIELIYNWITMQYDTFKVPIIGYIDNKSGVYWGEYSADEKLIGDGRYIIIADTGIKHYNRESVATEEEYFTSSIFYLNSVAETEMDMIYYEIPYTFSVVNGKADAEIYDATYNNPKIKGSGYSYTLYGDGDTILYNEPYREINLFSNGKRFTTLGRIALYSENNKQQYRKASICASEPYVQDTGFNGLSSFSTALVNYKDLDTQYGDIEAIDGMEDRIAVFQKYRCSQLQYKKHILSTATGDALVSKTQDIFGEQVFYALEYGLTDHHSLVKWGNSRFFVDQKRGAVLRIDYNGIHNISNNGMRNYFHKSLENYKGKIMACYDVAHSSYMLFHIVNGKMVCDNYYTPVDGWSAKFEIDPDIIINTMNGVFSFKNQLLYKHDVTPYPSIYGEYKDITIKIPCNENPLIIKNYTAIQVDSTTSPYFGRFITRQGESLVGSVDFEKTEMEYQSYIPMVNGVIASNPVFCCVVEKDTKGDDVKFKINSTVDIHNDDAVLVCMDNGEGVYEPIGATYRIKELTPSEMTVEGDIDIPAGAILMAVDESQINGHAHKDTSMMVELRFTSATVVKSITMDINESKI